MLMSTKLPWSNGLCERHNKILTDISLKTKEDTSCLWKIALALSLNAKNSLNNMSGFSPHQLAIEENIKLPNVMNDQLSAGSPETKTIGDHLLALHAAQKTFIAAESSDQIRRDLLNKQEIHRNYFPMVIMFITNGSQMERSRESYR